MNSRPVEAGSSLALSGNALTPSPCATSADAAPIESAVTAIRGSTPARRNPESESLRTLVPSPSATTSCPDNSAHVIRDRPDSGCEVGTTAWSGSGPSGALCTSSPCSTASLTTMSASPARSCSMTSGAVPVTSRTSAWGRGARKAAMMGGRTPSASEVSAAIVREPLSAFW